MGLLSIIRKHKVKSQTVRVVMLGLDSAGKSTIAAALLGTDLGAVAPTMGFAIETIPWNGFSVDVWDVGGQKTLRTFWDNYFDSTDALVWVVDVADVERLEESWQELATVLQKQGIRGASVLVWINKVDLVPDVDRKALIEQVIEKLGLRTLSSDYNVVCCSAVTREGLQEGMDWLVHAYKERYALG